MSRFNFNGMCEECKKKIGYKEAFVITNKDIFPDEMIVCEDCMNKLDEEALWSWL